MGQLSPWGLTRHLCKSVSEVTPRDLTGLAPFLTQNRNLVFQGPVPLTKIRSIYLNTSLHCPGPPLPLTLYIHHTTKCPKVSTNSSCYVRGERDLIDVLNVWDDQDTWYKLFSKWEKSCQIVSTCARFLSNQQVWHVECVYMLFSINTYMYVV